MVTREPAPPAGPRATTVAPAPQSPRKPRIEEPPAPERRRARAGSAGVDVVYTFSNVTWQAAARRGFFMSEDRLVRSLLSSDRVDRLLVCNHARSLPLKLLRDLSRTDQAIFPTDERTRLVEPVRLRRLDPASIRAVRRGFDRYDRALERAVRRVGMKNPVVITGHPLVAGFCNLEWARAVTWYAVDDWAEHPAYSRWWNAYRESYELVRARARRVAAVSSVLLERLAPTGPSAIVPNGLDPSEWIGDEAAPAWVSALPRPLLVYAGALDSRIDVDWLKTLADAQPSSSIVLIGPLTEPDHLAPLRAVPNVHFRDPVARGPLTALIRHADAGLLPHRVTRLTSAMSPLKLLEYLAAGLPVAATDLRPVRALGHPGVVLVPDGGDFAAAVRSALVIGRAPESERLAFVEGNSWRSRHDHVLDLAFA
jgi:teichuronic acid biosynthesis glycosyltransferase TuaH